MINRFITVAIVSSLFVLGMTTAQAARNIQPPEEVVKSIERTCRSLDDKDKERCIFREEQKWWESLQLTKLPKKHQEFLDEQDFGKGHLRERIKAERRTNFRKKVGERKTYRQIRPTDDLNTQRKDYLNDLKMMRLECQLKPKGRQRALCIDQVGNWGRKQMLKDTPSRRYPAS